MKDKTKKQITACLPVEIVEKFQHMNTTKLENIKKEFNDLNFSLVFSVLDNNRMNVTITDKQEKKPYCGISSRNIDDVEDFLRKNLEKIKKIA